MWRQRLTGVCRKFVCKVFSCLCNVLVQTCTNVIWVQTCTPISFLSSRLRRGLIPMLTCLPCLLLPLTVMLTFVEVFVVGLHVKTAIS